MSPGADVVDAVTVVAWARRGVRVLRAAREALDRVNVFPVPDADTGTNMYLTLLDAARALPTAPPPGTRAGDLLVRMARGALVGARGNSGVILSEFLRGLAIDLAEHRTISGPALAAALDRAARTARGAVARPAPGTILTAADAAARSAAAALAGAAVESTPAGRAATGGSSPAPVVVAAAARDGARAAALRSAGELDVLARARVLDAGALGLVLVLGALESALRRPTPDDETADEGVSEVLGMMSAMVPVPVGTDPSDSAPHVAHEGGEFEVMYVVVASGSEEVEARPALGRGPATSGAPDPAERLRAGLARIGDSVVVVGGDEAAGAGLWQAHVHTDDPVAAVAVGREVLASLGRADASVRQVRARHLPGQHEHLPGPLMVAAGAVAGGMAGGALDDATGPDPRAGAPAVGLVAVTTAPGLVADLARAGAVVLLRDPGSVPDLAALHRVVVDTRATHVALLAGADLEDGDVAALRASVRDDGVERLDVLPAPTDLHVVVALAATQLVEPDGGQRLDAATSALAGVRVTSADDARAPASVVEDVVTDVLEVLLADLLESPTEVLVVLADDDVPDEVVEVLAAASSAAGAEPVVLRSGRGGSGVSLAAESPAPAVEAPEPPALAQHRAEEGRA